MRTLWYNRHHVVTIEDGDRPARLLLTSKRTGKVQARRALLLDVAWLDAQPPRYVRQTIERMITR
jgi:hypothetical protein